ncbi:CLUMA_CG012671, isoform B [Clunio marinus]|uniref:CLUMA_CG012671, isoform B n=1 Tax=Clunio marinus TaxID=568069 RepID=A0A1J1IGC5_9DIPT|nr:CLUMA_CG012671, isoform B [Clunio marinus]
MLIRWKSKDKSSSGASKKKRKGREDDDFQHDKSNRNQIIDQVNDERNRRPTGRREDRERDIRRHTLGADMLLYGNQNMNQRSMDMEMNQSQKNRKGVAIRGYTPQSQGPLFDDDPGIMSEVETASTGFRRGGKQRSSLPVVRTPSKTLERPLGLVFLQYRSETKRALLPNEITSIDTVRALFVRSFPRQLSMAYLEGPNVKIYIHDSNKDMFYELEDMRSHLREIKDRSVLRLFESNEVTATPQILSGSAGIPQSLPQQGNIHWDQDPSYFSEPEFDSEYQHQHIHKSKTGKAAPYYVSAAQTLPRGHVYNDRSKSSMNMPSKPLRSYGSRGSLGHFSYPSEQLYNLSDGYMSSPERGNRAYEEPYYTPYCGARDNIAPTIIDEEQNDSLSADDQYSLYNAKIPNRITRNPNQMYDIARPDELHRIRVEHMERQLANLTGLVQKALVQNPTVTPAANQQQYTGVEGSFKNANGVLDDMSIRERPPKLGKSCKDNRSVEHFPISFIDKSVSFEKSVSFSDDIQGFPKAHNPQMERDRLKPIPPLKNKTSSNQYHADLTIAPDVYNHLRNLQKKARDMKIEIKTLRRLSQSQTIAVREDINDTFMRIRATLLATSGNQWGQFNQERTKISREEEIYKQEVIRLEKDLADLEASVEVLRGEVINRRTRVNMTAVEDMALVLSRASKTVAELKMKFPNLQQNLRSILADEMETFCREETFLKDEPDRLETALRRCKKLTGTLVTLKRLASVQEQRTIVEPTPPETSQNATNETLYVTSKPNFDDSAASDEGSKLQSTVSTKLPQIQFYPEPMSTTTHGLRRLHSYPSGSDTDQDNEKISTGKPPLPERNSELLLRYGQKKLPPPPPPRTSSNRSPLESPTSPSMVLKASEQQNMFNSGNSKGNIQNDPDSGSESNNSQDNSSQRQMQLENRHKELLKKQKQLQEQYQRLQQLNKSSIPLISNDANANAPKGNSENSEKTSENIIMHPQSSVSTNKVYETDIL